MPKILRVKLLCVKLLCVKLLCVKAALCANSSAFSVPLLPGRALPKLFSHLSVHSDAYPMLWFSFNLLRGSRSENQASTDRTPCKMKTPPAKNFFPCMSLCPAFRDHVRSLWHQFFGTIALMEFVLKNLCQQLCSFSLAPCQRSYACPMAQGLETLTSLGRTVFRNNRIDEICPKKPAPTAVHF